MAKDHGAAKRIGWLDTARMPSSIHKTLDDGATTVCGYTPRQAATVSKTMRHGELEPAWVIDSSIPRKILGLSRYCKTCFQDGGKSAPWVEG